MASAIIIEPAIAGNPVPFAFESHPIRTVSDEGQPWFVAKDVCIALTIPWRGKETLETIPKEWVRVRKLRTPYQKNGGIVNNKQNVTMVSEPAVYKLAFRSNKPEADRFTNWVASEVIPALRRTGKFETCPAPAFPAPEASRLTTAKERNALTGLVNRYVGMLPGGPHQEAYKAAWRKVHDVMGIGSIEELTVEQLPRAVLFVKSLVDVLPLPAADTLALPPARTRNTLDDYKALYKSLPDSPSMWLDLMNRACDAMNKYARELEAIRDEATRPFRANRKSNVQTYFDAATSPMHSLFDAAIAGVHPTYRMTYDALDGCRNVWRLLHKG